MMARFDVDAVLFDLDGTLLDTIDDIAEAAKRMLLELKRPARSPDQVRRFVGKGIPNLVARCLDDPALSDEAHADAVAVFMRHYHDVNGVHAAPYPGIRETLSGLHAMNLPMACVTNKAADFTVPLLEMMNMTRYFPVVVCGDTLAHKKPHPAMLEYACRELGVAPARALMVGDSTNDAACARAAGCPVVLMTYGYSEGVPVDTIECDGLLSNATALLARIGPQGKRQAAFSPVFPGLKPD